MINVRSYVRIAEDRTEAWLYLCAPEDEGMYEKSEILRYLQLNSVVAGINESNVAAMCKKQIYEREVKVASSVQGDPGHDGYFEFLFDTEKPKPKINSDGSVDYRSMSLVQNTTEGSLLAIYHPAVQGTSGRSVTGEFEKLTIYKDLRPLTGKGISNENSPNEYYATRSGKIEYEGGGKLSIVEVYEVTGGCDYARNAIIEFDGDVIVHGNVEAGVTIKVGKSLTVEGVVVAAMLDVGGDVCLKRGMKGDGKGTINAGGNVFTEFLEYTSVKAAGNVQSNVILNSQIDAAGTLTLTGKKGLVAGGSVHAMLGITCQNLGNSSEIRTNVHVGLLPELLEKRIEISQKYTKLNEELDEIVMGMAKILRIRQQTGELSEQFNEQLEMLKDKKNEVYDVCMDLKQEAEELDRMLVDAKEAKIKVNGNVYKGTIIGIDDSTLPVQREAKFMEYTSQNGVIISTVIP